MGILFNRDSEPGQQRSPWRHLPLLLVVGPAALLISGMVFSGNRSTANDVASGAAPPTEQAVVRETPAKRVVVVSASSPPAGDSLSVDDSVGTTETTLPSSTPALLSPEDRSGTIAGPSCELEGLVRSREAATPIAVRFDNQTGSDIELVWLDYDGKRQTYEVVKPGLTFERATYLTHPWLVIDPVSGQCLHLVADPVDDSEIVVRSRG